MNSKVIKGFKKEKSKTKGKHRNPLSREEIFCISIETGIERSPSSASC